MKFKLDKSISKMNLINTFKQSYDGLNDQDIIFTNLFCGGDRFIDGTLKRGNLYS